MQIAKLLRITWQLQHIDCWGWSVFHILLVLLLQVIHQCVLAASVEAATSVLVKVRDQDLRSPVLVGRLCWINAIQSACDKVGEEVGFAIQVTIWIRKPVPASLVQVRCGCEEFLLLATLWDSTLRKNLQELICVAMRPRGLHDQIRDVRNFLATERTRSYNVLQKFYRCCFLDIADRSMARCAFNACQSEPGCPQATRELQRRGGHRWRSVRRRACGLGARAGLDLEMLRGCVAILRYACARAGACRDNNVQTH